MLNGTSGIVKIVLSVVLFPTFFQAAFIAFAWGSGDATWVMISKRILLLLPVCAIILGCWTSLACLATVPVRQNRREFVTALFMTWWDLGKSIVSFWGGLLKMLFSFAVASLGLLRFVMFALWAIIQDLLMIPFAMIRHAMRVIVSSPIPWIAVGLTLFWCVIETVIFTYVTTPLVVDTFSNITGEQMSVTAVRIPLATFLFFIVLGSYAVLSTFVDSVRSKSIQAIIGIGVIEIIVLFVEVVFLYREFVDSLVPWFAQYSENFELGIFWTLAISCFAWFGIRSLSWFLFASHGTPTIMTVIQGKGLKISSKGKPVESPFFEISTGFMNKLKQEVEWSRRTGEELIGALMLPPLQVVAASINFCTLLVITKHIFSLPFTDMNAIKYVEGLTGNIINKKEPARRAARPAPAGHRPASQTQPASDWRHNDERSRESVTSGTMPDDSD